MDDKEIVNRCLDGDGDVFKELVTRHKKKIYNIAYKFTFNKEDALDITQEIFIKAYNSLEKYNPKYKFSSWILKMTTNYCLDIKKKKRVNTVELNTKLKNDKTTTSAEDVFIHKENKKIIKDAINNLSKEYRVLIILYHNENLSYKEISETLNLPLTKVKNRLYRARNMLKENLKNIKEEESKWTAKELQY
ncbi:RNA polymerase sigma factor [Dethiothermospora halolimnae]|uniref:RNA polymerase sigma factor n=1 Tax=Dethiothermospora halolimnae TaxID=3114390 RepID=UPI003CCBCA3C